MDPGRIFRSEKKGATNFFRYFGPKQNSDFCQLYARDLKLVCHQPSQSEDQDNYLNMDYEMHLETTIDYLFHQSSRLLQVNEVQLLQNKCKQERTQILINLMMGHKTHRLAGNMQTGNGLTFLEKDIKLAWQCLCPKVPSPVHTMNEYFHRIPIIFESEFQLVGPFNRQTYPDLKSRTVLIRMKTFSISIWTKKTHGIR